ncbi:hypothetical protein BC937DRAFT_92821 [Endogone sp. FLAS-F59071]|nr:hypothetical protein BC937DRAFT_92821 [Endogone sp. FLAS-F59071]|eukprot:RUS23062.1 hypothetical protein BC937DRAFT_92821 [Endogone sp. FLAS-F59071]
MSASSDSSFEATNTRFLQWLHDHSATISSKIAFKNYSNEGAGRGVVALEDIEEGELLFAIPRSILLSQYTSDLSKIESVRAELNSLKGWNPLILSMLYESQREDSKWKPYFEILPKSFSTPIFWSDEDLRELEGTSAHPDIFSPTIHTLSLFHTCGSLIMAYSFEDEPYLPSSPSEPDSDSDSDIPNVVITMVPLADMLNHRTGHNNARLFYEPEQLEMRATKAIATGTQVYNTYGDRPNSDLLRRYGFVDEVNDHDSVEISGELVVEVSCGEEEAKEQKVGIGLGVVEGGYESSYFVFDTTGDTPPALIVTALPTLPLCSGILLVKVLAMSATEFGASQRSATLPKSDMTPAVRDMLLEILQRRMATYRISVEDDVAILAALPASDPATLNRRNAVMVRLGEKRVLNRAVVKLRAWEPEPKRRKEKRQAWSGNAGKEGREKGGEGKKRKVV